MKTTTRLLALALACAIAPAVFAQANPSTVAGHAHAFDQSASSEHGLAHVVVHKSPYCGCCEQWVEHMRKAGFAVEVRNVTNLNPIKQRVGVPLAKGSCHTAQVGKYFIEGHVPAEDVKRLLAEQPDAKGLVVPGMPAGSPGMEVPDGSMDAYTVELVANDGSTSAFAQHGQ